MELTLLNEDSYTVFIEDESITSFQWYLDGVLIDSKKVHFNSLNQALSGIDKNIKITFDEHLKIYDGLPTLEKLKILNKKKLLNKKFNSKVYKLKQLYTSKELNKQIKYNEKIYKIRY